jgi:hypothetical protein
MSTSELLTFNVNHGIQTVIMTTIMPRHSYLPSYMSSNILFLTLKPITWRIYLLERRSVLHILYTLSFATTIQTQCFTSHNLFDHVR